MRATLLGAIEIFMNATHSSTDVCVIGKIFSVSPSTHSTDPIPAYKDRSARNVGSGISGPRYWMFCFLWIFGMFPCRSVMIPTITVLLLGPFFTCVVEPKVAAGGSQPPAAVSRSSAAFNPLCSRCNHVTLDRGAPLDQ